jgi:pimeloyl-ACP methyl ester carboxylesterase
MQTNLPLHSVFRRALTGLAPLLAMPLAACGQSEGRTVDLVPCEVPPADTQALCGTLAVPEDRPSGEGRTIDLSIVVLPATGEATDPDPVFPLHGGPGAAARYLVPLFASHPLRDSRDFVFVDQRGTGTSNGLHCEPAELPELMEVVLTFSVSAEDCRANEADPRLYVTSIAVEDLDDVRAALAYERINLWGGSYGSRAALEYMRRHPERVRTALLDGLAPMDMYVPLYFPPGAEAALALALEDCAEDDACRLRFPDPRGALDEALGRLEANPALVTIEDPRTGEPVELVFGREHLAGAVLYALYNSQSTARLPSWIHDANHGELTGIASFAAAFSVGIGRQFAFGMTLAVACSEDAARYTLKDAERVAEGTFLGSTLARNFLEACDRWPTGRVDPEYWAYVESDVPTLVFSGQGDPVTPPSWAERAVEHLEEARHVIFPDNGHGATGTPCGRELFEDFVRRGSAEAVEAACASENPRPAWGGTG